MIADKSDLKSNFEKTWWEKHGPLLQVGLSTLAIIIILGILGLVAVGELLFVAWLVMTVLWEIFRMLVRAALPEGLTGLADGASKETEASQQPQSSESAMSLPSCVNCGRFGIPLNQLNIGHLLTGSADAGTIRVLMCNDCFSITQSHLQEF